MNTTFPISRYVRPPSDIIVCRNGLVNEVQVARKGHQSTTMTHVANLKVKSGRQTVVDVNRTEKD